MSAEDYVRLPRCGKCARGSHHRCEHPDHSGPPAAHEATTACCCVIVPPHTAEVQA